MTKYKDLSTLAIDNATRFVGHKNACREVAETLALRTSEFLEAPQGTISFSKLDQDMKVVGDPGSSIVLTRGDDGFWYFGLHMRFSFPASAYISNVVLKFGILASGEQAEIKFEKSYVVRSAEASSWLPMLTDLEKDLETHYRSEPQRPSSAIGFIQPVRE